MTPSTYHLPREKHWKCYSCIGKAILLTSPRRVELCILTAVSASLQKKKPSTGESGKLYHSTGKCGNDTETFPCPSHWYEATSLHHYIMSCDKFRTRLWGCIMFGCYSYIPPPTVQHTFRTYFSCPMECDAKMDSVYVGKIVRFAITILNESACNMNLKTV
jgi:hypothetical protein